MIAKYVKGYLTIGGVFGGLALLDGYLQKQRVPDMTWTGILVDAAKDTVLWPLAVYSSISGTVAGRPFLQTIKGVRMLVTPTAPALPGPNGKPIEVPVAGGTQGGGTQGGADGRLPLQGTNKLVTVVRNGMTLSDAEGAKYTMDAAIIDGKLTAVQIWTDKDGRQSVQIAVINKTTGRPMIFT